MLCLAGSFFHTLIGMAKIINVDVAQGNSVIVGSTNPLEGVLPCLIDAGCESYKYRGKTFKAKQVAYIADELCRLATIANRQLYNIIISHAHTDHYNMLPEIVKKCSARGVQPNKIILGGVKALYDKAFQDFLDELTAKPDESPVESFVRNYYEAFNLERGDNGEDSEEVFVREIYDVWGPSDKESESLIAEKDEDSSANSFVSSYYEAFNLERGAHGEDSEEAFVRELYDAWGPSEEETESLNSSSHDVAHIPSVIYHTAAGNTTNIFEVAAGANLKYSILPALKATVDDQSNDGSLVVLIQHANLSYLVAGDATSKTTDHILTYCPGLKVHGLHAGHHGAEKYGCSSERWLRALQPKVIVFSSGLDKGYRHPQGTIVVRSSKFLPAGNGPYRPLYSGITKKTDLTDIFYQGICSNGYGLSVTQQNMVGTMGQGTIIFSMDPADQELRAPQCSLGDMYPDKKSCVMESLLKSPTILPLDILVTLNLAALGINDDIVVDRDCLHRLLIALKKDARSLNNVFLQENAIHQLVTVTRVEELFDECKYIKVLDMRDNGLSDALKMRLLKKTSGDGIACKL